ncbi:hypothetical protein HDV01_003604 [Terramyces sp. JEL0728]|nr:hypothetical protein HDV01_003604 [Terramyces sp. JEL0728]
MSGPPKLPPRRNPVRSPPLPPRNLGQGSDNSDDDKPLFPKGIPDGSDSDDNSPLVRQGINQPQYNPAQYQQYPYNNSYQQPTPVGDSSEDDAPLVQSTKLLMADMNRISHNATPMHTRNLPKYPNPSPDREVSPSASSDTPLYLQKKPDSDDDVPLQIRSQDKDGVPLGAMQVDQDDDVPLSALQRDVDDDVPLRALQRDKDDDVPLSALRKPLPVPPKEHKDKHHKQKSPGSVLTSNSGSDHHRKGKVRPTSYQPPQLNPDKKKHHSVAGDGKIPKYFNPDYLAPPAAPRPSSRATSGTESIISEASSYDINPIVLPSTFGNKQPEFKAPLPVKPKKVRRKSEVSSKPPMNEKKSAESMSKTSKTGTENSSHKSSELGSAKKVAKAISEQKNAPVKISPIKEKSPSKENKRTLKEDSSTESSDENVIKKAPKIETKIKEESSGTEESGDDGKHIEIEKEWPALRKMSSSGTEDSDGPKNATKPKQSITHKLPVEKEAKPEIKVEKIKGKKKNIKESSGTEEDDSDNESVEFQPIIQPFRFSPMLLELKQESPAPAQVATEITPSPSPIPKKALLKSPSSFERGLPKVFSLNFEPLDFDQDLDYFKAFVRSDSRNTNHSKDTSDDEAERRRKVVSAGLEEFKKTRTLRKSRSVLAPSANEYSKLKNELPLLSEERERRLQQAAAKEALKETPLQKSPSAMSIDQEPVQAVPERRRSSVRRQGSILDPGYDETQTEDRRTSIHARRSSLDPGPTIAESAVKEEKTFESKNRANSAMSIDEPHHESSESKKGNFAKLDVKFDEFKTMRSLKSGGLRSAISTITFRSDSVGYASDKEAFEDEPINVSPVQQQKPSYMLETTNRVKSPEVVKPSDSPSKVFAEMNLNSPQKGSPNRPNTNSQAPYPYPYPQMPYPYPYPVPPPKDAESETGQPQQYPGYYPYPYPYPLPPAPGSDQQASGQPYQYYPYPYPQYPPYPGQPPAQPYPAQNPGQPASQQYGQSQPSYPPAPGYPYYPPYPHQPPSHVSPEANQPNPHAPRPSYMPVEIQSPEKYDDAPVYRTNSINIKKFGPERDLSFHTGNTIRRNQSSRATIEDFAFDDSRASDSFTDTDVETAPSSPQQIPDDVRPSFTTLNRRATLGAKKLPLSTKEYLTNQKEALKLSTEQKELFEYAKLCLASNIEQFVDEGYAVLRKVANSNNYPEANVFLGDSYADDKKDGPAFSQYLIAAKKNYSPVFFKLGKCYEEGKGCKKSKRVAIEMYNKAAASGDLDAMYRLGLAELEGTLGLKPDIHKAIKWFKRASAVPNPQHPEPLYELCNIYEHGVEGIISPDKIYALGVLKEATEFGYAPAQYKLGYCYEHGLMGVDSNPSESIKLYTLAADQGNADGQLGLAGWHMTGVPDLLDQDEEKAFKLCTVAADAKLARAVFTLAYFYEKGIGAQESMDMALEKYKEAYELGKPRLTPGDERASKKLKKLDPNYLKVQNQKKKKGFLTSLFGGK